jgi:hypothetical protein
LIKYQVDSSLDLNGNDDFVDELVKNTYSDLFGDDENIVSGTDSVQLTKSRPANMYPVFKSDSTRKEMTCNTIDFQSTSLYHKGTLIMDNCYIFNQAIGPTQIVYQHPYCGDDISISFIIRMTDNYNGKLLETGHISVMSNSTTLSVNVCEKCKIDIKLNEWYFVTIRYSKALHIVDMTASIYTHPDNIPLYQLSNWHYFFDVDNAIQSVGRWNEEMHIGSSSEVIVHGFPGNMSNIKVFDIYNDKLSEMMMQYPTNSHLIINDTARPLYGLTGTTPK